MKRNNRSKSLESKISLFIQQYGRKRHAGHDPNDRRYDRGVERIIKRIAPDELDALMHGDPFRDETADSSDNAPSDPTTTIKRNDSLHNHHNANRTMNQLLTGQVVWYVTGRFYTTDNLTQDVGYFLHLQGIDGSLFLEDTTPGESTALFTFSSDPFAVTKISNGELSLGLDAVGGFSLYFNPNAGASFDDPASFAVGQKIATFSRVSVVVGLTITEEIAGGTEALSNNLFSAALVSTTPFEFGGVTYDLQDLIPNGITQSGTAGILLPSGTAPSTTGIPFVGSAIAVGAAVS